MNLNKKFVASIGLDAMDDLDRYIAKEKNRDSAFAKNFDEGYERFKAECAKMNPKKEQAFAEECMSRAPTEFDRQSRGSHRKQKP